MWAVKLLLKIMILPMILLIGVARLGVTLAIKIYGFASFWLWVLLGIVVIMTVCQQNWSQTILALSMGAITFVVLFAAVWIQVTLEDAILAEKRVSILMGDKADVRREWIEENVSFTLEDDYLEVNTRG